MPYLQHGYCWEIRRRGKVSHYVDADDGSKANWMRFVNCARTYEEQNMVAFQFHGGIYYRACTDIRTGAELLVYYGDSYAGELGIDKRKASAEQQEYKLHTHTERKICKCDTCEYRCTAYGELKKHMRAHTDAKRVDTGEKRLKSDGYRCTQASSVRDHMRTQTGEKPFACDTCGYRSAMASHLQTHMRTHTGEKPFACDTCGYRCAQANDLQRHMRTHTGEKPFACDTCGYRSAQASDLQKHMRTHTGEKPFACDTCGYRCAQASNLQTHMRTHTGEKPFACDTCGYRSAQASDLQRHMRTHTGEKPGLLEESVSRQAGQAQVRSPRRRYPRRNLARKNYREREVPDDDDYIFCDDCEREYEGHCPVHGPLKYIPDKKVDDTVYNPRRAEQTLPDGLSLWRSKITGAGQGIWTDMVVRKGSMFGPYKGEIRKITQNEAHVSGYCWAMRRRGKVSHYVDAEDGARANWMRFVNCARNYEEQNMVAFQFHGGMYYRTCTDIRTGAELLVYYGDSYAAELGIDRSKASAAAEQQQQQQQQYKLHNTHAERKICKCDTCEYRCTAYGELRKHMRAHADAKRVDTGEKRLETDGYRCTRASSVRDQMRTHTGEKPFACDTCGYRCAQASDLRDHMRTHTGEKPFACDTCGYRSAHASDLQTHMRTHTGEKPFACDTCGYRSARSSDLKKHMRTHTGEKTYYMRFRTCTDIRTGAELLVYYGDSYAAELGIDRSKASEQQEYKHTHTERKICKCDTCEYRCTGYGELKKHMRTHADAKHVDTGEKRLETDGYRCTQASSLRDHMRTHTGEKPFACDTCGYRSAHARHLQRHMRTHTGEKPFACDTCGYRSARSSSLLRHMRTHTGEKPFACDTCGYRSAHAHHLQRHMRTHTGEKPFVCDTCGYRSAHACNLQTHMRTHTGEKPFACDTCGFRSAHAHSLRDHMRTHTGEKPFACDTCEYRSAHARSLRDHMRTHTGEKPFACDTCGYRSASGEKPFACDTCGYRSAKASDLQTHMRAHTGEKPFACDTCGYRSAKIRRRGKVSHYVDAYDVARANWMRFVNCARNYEEQNMVAFQFHGGMYYRSHLNVDNTVIHGRSSHRDLLATLQLDTERPVCSIDISKHVYWTIIGGWRLPFGHYQFRLNLSGKRLIELHLAGADGSSMYRDDVIIPQQQSKT
ncbi:PREDICTED: histone-lysine N-methyltransferase PRDM9-like [Priapulus caudatus]|uniref:Histone-lysine N-methyltransferase PRDM9-like n=1 Tax=Priapulus caudatus TaxID=37621 RepID=A0ABM1EMN7_PRICU|nr:PREDICTED: histone-lysine N-methyltransferase PRDM9-like [Priapulus caudatus]